MDSNQHFHFDGCKLLWHMDRVHDYYRDHKRVYPLHIDVGATKMCQARCIYCYGIYQKMSTDIIPEHALVSNLCESSAKIGVKSIVFTGDGEPLLNPAIYDAVRVCKKGGIDVGIATNGIALDLEKIKILLENCTWIRFNLSAHDFASYKAIHGTSSWTRVRQNIIDACILKATLGLKCTIGLQMVLIPQCLDSVIPEAEFAVRTNVDYMVIKQFSDPGCIEMSQFDLSLYDSHVVDAILSRAESMSTPTTRIIAKRKMMSWKGTRPYTNCLDCPLIFQVSGNSRAYPCGFLFNNEDYCYGNLKTHTLKEICDSEHYWSVIEKMKTFDVARQCKGSCRHDFTNEFIHQYLNPPDHINFI